MSIDIDRAGFVERRECYCENAQDRCAFRGSAWWWPHGGHSMAWVDANGRTCRCDHCGAELAVFTDIDGTRHPMVRRAGFWRDVAMGVAAVRRVVLTILATRDGLNAQADGETMGVADRTEIQWSGKPESEARE